MFAKSCVTTAAARRPRGVRGLAVMLSAGVVALGLSAGTAGATEAAEGTETLCPSGPFVDPVDDPHSLYNTAKEIGAFAYWNAGYTGAGVDVAVIDTGVAPVPGLDTPGKVIHGPDLSFESQSTNQRYRDTFGHGTHLASIITGIASGARIVSVKVGDNDGAVDVTQVIAAIDWVVQHRNDAGMNIRVLNLAYGLESGQSVANDPLAYAVEQAWKAGIVVVVSGGNDGETDVNSKKPLNSPAYSHRIIAVGSYDPAANPMALSTFTSDSSRRIVDFVAPGASIAAARVCGSAQDEAIAQDWAEADATRTPRVNPYVGDTLVRGSGTSQSAAVVSGAVALMLQKNPCWWPEQVKSVLRETAVAIKDAPINAQGQGRVNLASAFRERRNCVTYTGQSGWSTGTGSIELARGGSSLVAANGVVLTGERDIFGRPLDVYRLAGQSYVDNKTQKLTNGGAWRMTPAGESWNGVVMAGTGFTFDAGLGTLAWGAVRWPTSFSGGLFADPDWDRASWRTDDFQRGSWRTDSFERASWRSIFLRASWRHVNWR